MASNGSGSDKTQENSQWMVQGSQPVRPQRGSQPAPQSHPPLQSGSIDLVADLGANGLEDDDDDDDDDYSDGLAEADSQPSVPFPEDQRFKHPETPAVGNKNEPRDMTTPRLPANPFGKPAGPESGGLNMTQAFRMTQAPTSPLPPALPSDASERPSPALHFPVAGPTNVLLSDFVSEKPSPSLFDGQRPSSVHAVTSPLASRKPMTRAITAPYISYVPMKESQEERRRRGGPLGEEDVEDGEPFSRDFAVPTPARRGGSLLGKRTRDDRARFDSAAATVRPSSSGGDAQTRRVTSPPKHVQSSPVPTRRGSMPITISDDQTGNATDEETEREEPKPDSDDDMADELGEENKENIDFKRTPIHIARSTPIRRSSQRLSQPRPGSRISQRQLSPDTSPDELAEESPSKRVRLTPAQQPQTITIADSQPSQSRAQHRRNGPSRQSGLESSGESRRVVPQSQPLERTPATTQPPRSQRTITPPPSSEKRQAKSSPRVRRSPRQRKTSHQTQSDQEIPSSPPQIPQVPSKAGGSSSTGPKQNLSGVESKFTEAQRPEALQKPSFHSTYLSSAPGELSKRPFSQALEHTPLKNGVPPSTIPETEYQSRSESRLVSFIAAPQTNGSSRAAKSLNDLGSQQPDNSAWESNGYATAPTHLSRRSALSKTENYAEPQGTAPKRTKQLRPLGDINGHSVPRDDESSLNIDDLPLMSKDDRDFQAEMEAHTSPASSQPRPINGKRRLNKRPIGHAHQSSDRLSAPSSTPVNPREDQRPNKGQVDTGNPSSVVEIEMKDFNSSVQNSEMVQPPSLSDVVSLPPVSLISPETSSPVKVAEPARSLAKGAKIEHKPSAQEAAPSFIMARHFNPKPKKRPSKLRGSISAPENNTYNRPASRGSGEEPIRAPTRVFALFPGTPAGYYSATCLAISDLAEPNSKLAVRFDDGSRTKIPPFQVKRLQLFQGDLVKVNRTGMRASTFIVDGMIPNTGRESVSASFPETDTHGHVKVRLRPKQSSAGGKEEDIAIPVTEIYLTSTIFGSLKGREYSHSEIAARRHADVDDANCSTSDAHAAPIASRRISKPSKRKFGNKNEAPIALPATDGKSGLFADIVFALTAVANLDERKEAEKLILQHGGTLLTSEQGFEDLFDVPAPAKFPAKPVGMSRSSALPTSSATASGSGTPTSSSIPQADVGEFALSRYFAGARFAVLLSDHYSRSVKFLQALAVGLPCLALRWVRDCVRRKEILPWQPYLLASGESAYLGGAICSRTLSYPEPLRQDKDLPDNQDENNGTDEAPAIPSPDNLVPLHRMVAAHPSWLAGRSVLLVGSDREPMPAYVFLAYALGAARVGVAHGTRVAGQVLADGIAGPWDWVCVHDGNERDADNAAENGGGGASGGGRATKKRKSGAASKRESSMAGSVSAVEKLAGERRGLCGKVVGTEFVVQSLILGRLLEDLDEDA